METESEMRQAIVTCRTDNCLNADIPITVPISWPDYTVICGACNQRITNVQVQEGDAS